MRIGAGMIGLTHPHSAGHLRTLDALEQIGDVVLYDPDPTARAAGPEMSRKVRAVDADLRALLARPDVSVVVIALPNDQACGAIVEAARAGKHIICEKPCGRSGAEFRPAADAIARHGVGFTVCYVWRAHPAVQRMRELVQMGAVGRLVSAELRMVTSQVGFRDPRHWLFKRAAAGGGIFSWLGCHWLDALRYIAGQEVRAASAMVGNVGGEAIDVEDVGIAGLRLSGGALASLYAGYLLPFGRPGYEGATFDYGMIFRGEAGTVDYRRSGDEHHVTLRRAASGRPNPERGSAALEEVDRYVLAPEPVYGGVPGLRFVETFLRGIDDGSRASFASADDALQVLTILDAIYLSAQTGKAVELAGSD
ncbi:MAG TPA: Gfo/Idh/MocA family oxidoreductase [bacterium]|nr:Gfo/Idh/MocA family oxidoreductase [bacterium]